MTTDLDSRAAKIMGYPYTHNWEDRTIDVTIPEWGVYTDYSPSKSWQAVGILIEFAEKNDKNLCIVRLVAKDLVREVYFGDTPMTPGGAYIKTKRVEGEITPAHITEAFCFSFEKESGND